MIPTMYKELITRINQKTKAGKANWETTATNGVYMIQLGLYSMSIEYDEGFHAPEAIHINIVDSDGDNIDQISEYSGEDDWLLLRELFYSAQRSSRGADKAIREILQNLNENDVIGRKKYDSSGPAPEDDLPF